jgi:pimeloyl-ACP methyl ester carboxylesterase
MKQNLVIIPGWRETSESFSEVKKELENYFNVYVIDLPGFKTPLERPYYLEDYLNFLEEKLKDVDNFYLLGHSFGGALAALYSLKHKDKAKKLILYDSAIVRKKTLKVRIVYLLTKILKIFEKILPTKIANLFKKFYYRFVVGSYDYFLGDENLKKTFANIIDKDLTEEIKKIEVKTYIIWGQSDKVTPLKQGYLLKKLIPNSEILIVDGGHSFHKEKPEVLVNVLKKIKE